MEKRKIDDRSFKTQMELSTQESKEKSKDEGLEEPKMDKPKDEVLDKPKVKDVVPTKKVPLRMDDKYMVRVLGEKDGTKFHYKKDAVAFIDNDKREKVTLELLKINVNKNGEITSMEKLKNYVKKPLTAHQKWMQTYMSNKGFMDKYKNKDGKIDKTGFGKASKTINSLYNLAKGTGKITVQ